MYELISLWESNGVGEYESGELAKSESGAYVVWMYRKARNIIVDGKRIHRPAERTAKGIRCESYAKAAGLLSHNGLSRMALSAYNDKSPF